MRPMWQTLVMVYVIAIALNYPWELAQSPLFRSPFQGENVWLHCFIASLGDGLMVLLLFVFGWLAVGRRDWFMRPGIRGYATLLASGAALAVAVEWVAVHVLHRWAYAETMPLLPALQVGVVPVLQMMVLPPVIFLIARTLGGSTTFRPEPKS